MNLSPYPNLHKAEKIKSTLRILQKERVCTPRSLIDRWCGIGGGGGWKKYQKLIVKGEGGGIVERVGKK